MARAASTARVTTLAAVTDPDPLAAALADAGGPDAPQRRGAQLRGLTAGALEHGQAQLAQTRSGYGRPVAALFARSPDGGAVRAVLPLAPELRADPGAGPERGWLLAAAATGALVAAAGAGPPSGAGEMLLLAGSWERWLALQIALAPGGGGGDAPELAALHFEEQTAGMDRLRTAAYALPAHVLDGATDLRAPRGEDHPLRVAEVVARMGGRPADPASVDALEDAVLAIVRPPSSVIRPHDDPDPARRMARRILQRLSGMGKWGGYHTDFQHLSRGFEGNERALAGKVGERLLEAGLLCEKRSVGQRHVFLNPRRAGDIHRLVDEGAVPGDLRLPEADG